MEIPPVHLRISFNRQMYSILLSFAFLSLTLCLLRFDISILPSDTIAALKGLISAATGVHLSLKAIVIT